tara:strand:- start:3538 stop:4023 length:486 start_codon:yes stop_codon:yes gene_type:complete
MFEKFKVTDLVPKRSEFYLGILEKTFYLRPCTPKDIIDLKNKGLDVDKIMQNPISEDLSRIVLYLMEYESAKEFKKVTVRTIDVETGEEKIEDLGGYNLLLKCVGSVTEQMEMFFCLLNSMGFSSEQIENLRKETLESINSNDFDKKVKKKEKPTKKKKAS